MNLNKNLWSIGPDGSIVSPESPAANQIRLRHQRPLEAPGLLRGR